MNQGYAKLTNSAMDALIKCRIPGCEAQIFWLIFRKTIGWRKQTDRIALSQFSQSTGIRKQHIHRLLNNLKKKRMIHITLDAHERRHYSVNFRFLQWQGMEGTEDSEVTKKSTPGTETGDTHTHNGEPSSPPMVITTDTEQTIPSTTTLSTGEGRGEVETGTLQELIRFAADTFGMTIIGKNRELLEQLLTHHSIQVVESALLNFAAYQEHSQDRRHYCIQRRFASFAEHFDLFTDSRRIDQRLQKERQWFLDKEQSAALNRPTSPDPVRAAHAPVHAVHVEEDRGIQAEYLQELIDGYETEAASQGMSVEERFAGFPHHLQKYRQFKQMKAQL